MPLTAAITAHVAAVQHKPPAATKVANRLDALYREHSQMIFRTAYRITNSVTEAEDALQTVFLRLVQHDRIATLEANPVGYLHRAAINAALDCVRHRRRAANVSLGDFGDDLTDKQSSNPENEQSERELRELLKRAVARLNPKSAEMFVLRYFEGKSNGEIARLLDTSPLVVAVMLHRARTRVRSEIGEFLGASS